MDLSRLRDAALREGEAEEAVTVDTRALIDKVLARYSGEWTTLRELIQNAADARATTVKVRWETHPSTDVPLPASAATNRSELLKHVLSHHTLRRLLVQNDGQPFTKTDWGRLKRIAEGNPDETKIGAFGVGFYSVFADCEEPFVSSGSEAMAFYWKGNALFTRKLNIPEGQGSNDTTFMLDYRNTTTPLPNLLSVSQFLATSLTFVALERMEFWIDDFEILSLHKKASPPLTIPIPKDLETRTREGLMTVTAVSRTSTQIDATAMKAIGWKPPKSSTAKPSDHYGSGGADVSTIKSFFSKLTTSHAAQVAAREKALREEKAALEALTEDVTVTKSSTIFLRATSADVNTNVAASFSQELERATKKPPPKRTKISILTSSYDETVATESSRDPSGSNDVDVFATVLPSKKPGGRIFIGFPTTQTTGSGMHISAPSVIPTVEREAIDLNARWVRTWNIELLRCAGIVVRVAYGNEMEDLGQKIKRSAKGGKVTAADVAAFIPEALHVIKTFTFSESTPSRNVGEIIEESFWMAFRQATIEVLSSRGVMLTTKVRVDDEELSKFVDGIPVIPKELQDNPFLRKLVEFGLIGHIRVKDIRDELVQKALTKEQLIHFISWAAKKSATGELDPPSRVSLLGVAVAQVGDGDCGEIISLGSITNFLVSNRIPPSMPIPPSTIPFQFTHHCKTAELERLGWSPLEILPWLRYLLEFAPRAPDAQNITEDAAFAVNVLTVLSKNWENISANHRTTIVSVLQSVAVMPTKMGMKKPAESYFQDVKLFDDLPTLDPSCSTLKEKFLTAIGVRKTVELDTIFARLLNNPSGSGGWSHVELIKYLASVRADIPQADMKKLVESRICPAEAGPKGMESTKPTTQLFKVNELFEPKDSHRLLGVRCLQWPGPPGSYRPNGSEGKFLTALGLRPFPTVPELVDMMCSVDEDKRVNAMNYFIGSHHINGYARFDLSGSNKAFLPIQGSEKKSLVRPSQCFTNPNCAILGYKVLRPELHQHASKFGVAKDPPIGECVSIMISKPPETIDRAKQVFEYFASRLAEIGRLQVSQLAVARFVPIMRRSMGGKHLAFVTPRNCYLGSSATYEQIFDFVNFGETANAFLFKCGAKSEPTKIEVAEMACSEPARLLSILESPEKYLNLLRSLATEMGTLKREKNLWRQMKAAPFLLGFKETPRPQKLVDVDEENDELPPRDYQLAPAGSIVIADDYVSYRLFKDSLVCAPEEDTLEAFYLALGAQQLSNMVHEEVRIGSHYEKQETAYRMRKHILERTKLFLYEFCKYNRDAVKHDANWLDKNLSVEVVRSVQLRRSLRGHRESQTEKRYAASVYQDGTWVIYVAHGQRDDMYQVGQAICQLILQRPSQQAYLFFEPFLNLDLLQLRDRGYNVDRILRARAAEARIAEEAKRKALEDEQRVRRQQEMERAQQIEATQLQDGSEERPPTPPEKGPAALMPGSFGPDSPENNKSPRARSDSTSRKGKGLLNNISRSLGFKSTDDAQQQLSRLLSGNNASGSGEDFETNHDDAAGNKLRFDKENDDGRVTDPAIVGQNLSRAVKSTRPHGEGELFTPPSTNEVKEQSSYCDSTTAKDLAWRAEAGNGMRVYADRSIPQGGAITFFRTQVKAVNAFAELLAGVCRVYELDAKTMHIFYDERGATIAFNSAGSIFCNLRFFLQIHGERMKVVKGAPPRTDEERAHAKADASIYWFVCVAHELAHNLVKPHNSEHSYYTESFIQQYWMRLTNQLIATGTLRTSGIASANAATRPELPPPPSSSRDGQLGRQPSSSTLGGPPPPYRERPSMQSARTGNGVYGDFN